MIAHDNHLVVRFNYSSKYNFEQYCADGILSYRVMVMVLFSDVVVQIIWCSQHGQCLWYVVDTYFISII